MSTKKLQIAPHFALTFVRVKMYSQIAFLPQNEFTLSKCIHKLGCLTVRRNERSFFKMRVNSIIVQVFGDC